MDGEAVSLLAIALLGGLGACGRYLLDLAVQRRHSSALPLGTVLVNVLGSAATGALLGLHWSGALGTGTWDLATVGLLGGFTTASTISFEAVRLLEERRFAAAMGVSLGTLTAALGFAALTAWLCGP